jgi:galactokinase
MDLVACFHDQFTAKPAVRACAPGRVNLLGEHVDYNGGAVLPAAIDRAVNLVAAPDREPVVRLYAQNLGEATAFQLDRLEAKLDLDGKPLPKWAHYPAGVAWALQAAGLTASGLKAVYNSDIPIGAGLSSSAAVEMAFAVTWEALGGWRIDRMQMARLCQQAENGYVGVNCGLMDQFASAHGVAGHALYFDTRSLDWEAVPLPPGVALVIADSGVRRSLSTSAYNERRAACEQAVQQLKQYLPQIQSLRDVSPVEFAAYSEFLAPEICKRAEHVVKEIARVESAVTALKSGKKQSFGALMYSGHASLRDLYQVSTPELDALVAIAHDLPGCIGARLTGAGFGGCTINLVEETQAPDFIQGLQQGYLAKTGRQAQVYLCRASGGAAAEWTG